MELADEGAHHRAIAESWERCAHRHNLVPSLARPIMRLRREEISHRREAFCETVSGELRHLNQLARLASETSSCLVVADRDQILLDIHCTDTTRDVFESRGVAPGSNWDERIAGTNGVSMANHCGRAVTVRGAEHFYQTLRPFACTAVPVLDARDEVIAYLNFTTVDRGNAADFAFARHVLNSAADRLQAWAFLRRFQDRITLRVSGGAAGRSERSNALVALDDDGRIIALTGAARDVLPGADTAGPLQGRSFEESFGARIADVAGGLPEPGAGLHASGAVRVSLIGPAAPMRRAPAPAPRMRGPGPSHGFLALAQSGVVPPARLDQACRVLQGGSPLLIQGPTGSGKTHIALTLLAETAPGTTPAVLDVQTEREDEIAAQIRRWSRGEAPSPTALLIETVEGLSPRLQKALLGWLERPLPPGAARPKVVATRGQSTDAARVLIPGLGHFLGGFVLDLPPVHALESRERLTRHLLRLLDPETPPALGADAMAAIAGYDWPGNIRELRAALDIARATCPQGVITSADLPAHVSAHVSARRERPETQEDGTALAEALRLSDWNVSRAAKLMGLSRATINRRIRDLDLHRPGKPAGHRGA